MFLSRGDRDHGDAFQTHPVSQASARGEALLCPWGFSREEYWSGLLFPSPGDLPDPGIELGSPALQADSLPAEPPGKPSEPRVSPECNAEIAFAPAEEH